MDNICPICRSRRSKSIIKRDGVPATQNRKFQSRDTARSVATGNLEYRECTQCGFIWNCAFDPTLTPYDRNYENCQDKSESFKKHLALRIKRIVESVGSGLDLTIVEIGCGQGDFLSQLIDQLDGRVASAYGFDPAWSGTDGEGPNGSFIFRKFLTAETAADLSIDPDVVISRHTIEHVADPMSFLASIRTVSTIGKTRVFLETPTNDWIIANHAIHDFFYEHCSLFDIQSIATALNGSQLQPTRIESVFGDQYLWAEARPVESVKPAFADTQETYKRRWESEIATAQNGSRKVAVWGAGAKGATFACLIDPDCAVIDCFIDINPAKQGGFLPRTGHPVVSPQTAHERGITHALVMNPQYVSEISAYMDQVGLGFNLTIVE